MSSTTPMFPLLDLGPSLLIEDVATEVSPDSAVTDVNLLESSLSSQYMCYPMWISNGEIAAPFASSKLPVLPAAAPFLQLPVMADCRVPLAAIGRASSASSDMSDASPTHEVPVESPSSTAASSPSSSSPDGDMDPAEVSEVAGERAGGARSCKRREPHREEFEDDAIFQIAWAKWRRVRDNNNQAVKKSRDKRRGVHSRGTSRVISPRESHPLPIARRPGSVAVAAGMAEVSELRELVRVLASALYSHSSLSLRDERRVNRVLAECPAPESARKRRG